MRGESGSSQLAIAAAIRIDIAIPQRRIERLLQRNASAEISGARI